MEEGDPNKYVEAGQLATIAFETYVLVPGSIA